MYLIICHCCHFFLFVFLHHLDIFTFCQDFIIVIAVLRRQRQQIDRTLSLPYCLNFFNWYLKDFHFEGCFNSWIDIYKPFVAFYALRACFLVFCTLTIYESPFACLQNQFFQIFNSYSSDYIFFSFVYFDFPLLWEHLNAFKGLPEKPLLFTWKIKVSVVVHTIIMIKLSVTTTKWTGLWLVRNNKQHLPMKRTVNYLQPTTNFLHRPGSLKVSFLFTSI